MDCLLIFNHLNDLVFAKYNLKLADHIKSLALNYGLISKEEANSPVDKNVFIQIFSPIVSSHRIMNFQFGNSYTTIEFGEKMKLCFIEYMGYLFMAITDRLFDGLINIYVSFARYLCGPDINQLKLDKRKSDLYATIIDQWQMLHNSEQAVLVEAVEQLLVNSEITAACLQSLKESVSKVNVHPESSKVHGVLIVDNKLLSLYSSPSARPLSSVDILFTIILTHCYNKSLEVIQSFAVYLAGPEPEPKCLPHSVHILEIFENTFLVYLVEVGDSTVSAALYETFYHLHKLRFIQVQREVESIQLGYENLTLAMKKLNDGLKKCKIKSVESPHRQIMKKWDVLKEKYKEYLRTTSDEPILRAETLALSFLDNLKNIYSISLSDELTLKTSAAHIEPAIPKLKDNLAIFKDFFIAKGIKNFTLGSYLEDFPGLVHFLHVDRNTHRVTTPCLDMQAEKAQYIQEKIWFMFRLARSHLQEGNTTVIWKDKMFTYGYFLWFENSSGEALKIPVVGPMSDKCPGILTEDFYVKLKTSCFPKMSTSKVRIYELYVMHLGLVTAASILEQAKKLAATIWDLKGFPTHAIDLL
ncbi:uncharacterized protein LOC126741666 isoform X2 [Anthonomus grandis grandis]|uniref:uncharacterized protein LOC126741666 isoform X2 n=1 Tax=Anthonomus grandis grandis TaxID=2921223 RepID=UPI002165C145|nr:uncharacterized protein LOC126741666 isoform X2 [Anthonomus grandis grandis]